MFPSFQATLFRPIGRSSAFFYSSSHSLFPWLASVYTNLLALLLIYLKYSEKIHRKQVQEVGSFLCINSLSHVVYTFNFHHAFESSMRSSSTAWASYYFSPHFKQMTVGNGAWTLRHSGDEGKASSFPFHGKATHVTVWTFSVKKILLTFFHTSCHLTVFNGKDSHDGRNSS